MHRYDGIDKDGEEVEQCIELKYNCPFLDRPVHIESTELSYITDWLDMVLL